MPSRAGQNKFLAHLRVTVPRFLLLFLPVAAFLTISIWIFYQQQIRNEKHMLKSEQYHKVYLEHTGMTALLHDVVTDALIQSQHYALLNWPENPGPAVKAHLAGEFENVARNTRIYSQISFLDQAGRVVVQVDYRDGRTTVAPPDRMPNRAGRTYFQRAIALKQGQVYISSLRFHPEPEPARPPTRHELRAAAPVFDRRGRKQGVVALTYRAERLLRALKKLEGGRGQPMLLDAQGLMLLKQRRPVDGPRFAELFPMAWRVIANQERGQFFTPAGFFTFATVHSPEEVDQTPIWKIVSFVRAAKVDASVGMYLRQLAQLLAVFLAVAALICWFLARAQVKQRAAQAAAGDKQQHLDEDLRAAAGIQRTLLPSNLPRLPEVELAWKFTPSELIGGDLFNAYLLGPRHLALYLLDVSGHGVPAALVTVSVHETLDPSGGHVLSTGSGGEAVITPPGQVLRILDREYPLERFGKTFTIVYLILDLASGRLVYSSAGHPPPLLLKNGGGSERLTQGGTVIGLDEVIPFQEGRLDLAPGDKLILYTDGVVEYGDAQGRLFGEQRLTTLLERLRNLPMAVLLERTWQELLAFGDQKSPRDDVSLLGLEFKGSS